MHLRSDTVIPEFLSAVRHCSADVYFETEEGDCLNLKSVLSQYILCTLVSEPALLASGSIRLSNRSDMEYLTDYLEGNDDN